MIRVWAVLFGLAVALAAGMVVKATFAKAAAQFERHVQPGPDDVETAARVGVGSGGGVFIRAHRQISSRLLSSGSEASS
jgi:hypothetical protein